MYFVYAIKSQLKDWIYIGMTDNIERRLNQHNLGYNRSTKAYRPFQLLFQENFTTRTEARNREKPLNPLLPIFYFV
ncbi:MAG: GIY-YIG nuclease family protein [Salegentibacter sp.]